MSLPSLYYKNGNILGEDLALLANCNHTIMSFGTFGMWGAMLAGGNVVLPSQILEVGFVLSSPLPYHIR